VSDTRVEVLGDEELLAKLRALGNKSGEALKPATLAGAGVVAETAEQKAPRRTDFLAEHIVVELIEEEDTLVVAGVGPHKDAFWGTFQELGTPHHAAQPFLRPALDETAEKVTKKIGEAAWHELERAAR